MLPHVPNGKDQVGCEFVLELQLPVLDHAGAAVVKGNVADGVVGERVQRWILGVARWCVGRETCIQGRNGRKVVGILEVRIGGRAAAKVTSKIRVCEGSVIDAVATPNNGFRIRIWRSGETDPRANVLEVGAGPGSALPINQCARRSRTGGIDGGKR